MANEDGFCGLFDGVVEHEVPKEEDFVKKRRRYKMFDFLNDLNYTKRGIIHGDPDAIKDFSPYIINRAMSMGSDTVLFANEMNIRYGLDTDMVYDFYLYGLRKAKRFNKWQKAENLDELEMIAGFFGLSLAKTKDILPLLNDSDIDKIRKFMTEGVEK